MSEAILLGVGASTTGATGSYQHEGRDRNREALQQQIATATVPHGVLAYDDGKKPIGWCAVAARADYPRLRPDAGRPGNPGRAEGLWSVTCFVVRVGHRRQGVASQLLEAAVQFAGRHGARMVEAYPVDPSVRPTGSSGLYQGTLSMYLRAGFTAGWPGRAGPERSSDSPWPRSG